MRLRPNSRSSLKTRVAERSIRVFASENPGAKILVISYAADKTRVAKFSNGSIVYERGVTGES